MPVLLLTIAASLLLWVENCVLFIRSFNKRPMAVMVNESKTKANALGINKPPSRVVKQP